MACTQEFIGFIAHQLSDVGTVQCRKMFGDWCIYINEKPAILACDNITYIRKSPIIDGMMEDAECGYPYDGAKEHYILDLGHKERAEEIIKTLLPTLKYPQKKKNNI